MARLAEDRVQPAPRDARATRAGPRPATACSASGVWAKSTITSNGCPSAIGSKRPGTQPAALERGGRDVGVDAELASGRVGPSALRALCSPGRRVCRRRVPSGAATSNHAPLERPAAAPQAVVGARAAPVADRAPAALLHVGGELPRQRLVGVDDGQRDGAVTANEQPALARAVALHVPVAAQVVVAQVREDRGRREGTRRPLELVARDLDRRRGRGGRAARSAAARRSCCRRAAREPAGPQRGEESGRPCPCRWSPSPATSAAAAASRARARRPPARRRPRVAHRRRVERHARALDHGDGRRPRSAARSRRRGRPRPRRGPARRASRPGRGVDAVPRAHLRAGRAQRADRRQPRRGPCRGRGARRARARLRARRSSSARRLARP